MVCKLMVVVDVLCEWLDILLGWVGSVVVCKVCDEVLMGLIGLCFVLFLEVKVLVLGWVDIDVVLV